MSPDEDPGLSCMHLSFSTTPDNVCPLVQEEEVCATMTCFFNAMDKTLHRAAL